MNFKNTKVSVIVCDLDGTLLNNRKGLSQENIDTLIKAQEKGYTLVLATGRSFSMTKTFASQLKMDQYNGYIVSFNGQQVNELGTGTVHKEKLIEPDVVKKVYTYAKKNKLQFIIEGYDEFLVYRPKALFFVSLYFSYKRFMTRKQLKKQENHPLISSFLQTHFLNFIKIKNAKQLNQSFPKMGISHIPAIVTKHVKKLELKFREDVQIMRVAPYWIDIVPIGINKAVGLQWISERLNVPQSEFLAFGDSENDVDMFNYAGVSIAMKNAMEVTKSSATFVSTFSNDDHGVSQELLKRM